MARVPLTVPVVRVGYSAAIGLGCDCETQTPGGETLGNFVAAARQVETKPKQETIDRSAVMIRSAGYGSLYSSPSHRVISRKVGTKKKPFMRNPHHEGS